MKWSYVRHLSNPADGFLRKVRLELDPHMLDLQGEWWHLKSSSQSWRPI